MSDIKFDGEEVIVEGNWLESRTLDFKLDAPTRRSSSGGERRALVHDFDDGLTINWAGDYPGGVKINGAVGSSNNQLNLTTWDLCLDQPSRRSSTGGHRRALVHDFSDGLTINWAGDYPGGVTIRGDVEVPNSLTVQGTNVKPKLDDLQALITALEARVSALEP